MNGLRITSSFYHGSVGQKFASLDVHPPTGGVTGPFFWRYGIPARADRPSVGRHTNDRGKQKKRENRPLFLHKRVFALDMLFSMKSLTTEMDMAKYLLTAPQVALIYQKSFYLIVCYRSELRLLEVRQDDGRRFYPAWPWDQFDPAPPFTWGGIPQYGHGLCFANFQGVI